MMFSFPKLTLFILQVMLIQHSWTRDKVHQKGYGCKKMHCRWSRYHWATWETHPHPYETYHVHYRDDFHVIYSFYSDPWMKLLFSLNIKDSCSASQQCSAFTVQTCINHLFSLAARGLRAWWPIHSKSASSRCTFLPPVLAPFLTLPAFVVLLIYAPFILYAL